MRTPYYSDKVRGLMMGPVGWLHDRWLFSFQIGDFNGQVVWFIGDTQQQSATLVDNVDRLPMRNRKQANLIKHEMHRIAGMWMRDYKGRKQLELNLQ